MVGVIYIYIYMYICLYTENKRLVRAVSERVKLPVEESIKVKMVAGGGGVGLYEDSRGG